MPWFKVGQKFLSTIILMCHFAYYGTLNLKPTVHKIFVSVKKYSEKIFIPKYLIITVCYCTTRLPLLSVQ